VLRTVGEHWTQRYLVQGKKELMVIPDTWSIQAGTWMKEGSFNRPWLKVLRGCHVTALNHFDGTYHEMGTGCEGCHGPGRRHAESSDQDGDRQPGRPRREPAQHDLRVLHTAGHDRSGNFRYPVGYRPGEDLMRSYRGLVPKPGQDVTNYKGDNTYEDRHRQFLFLGLAGEHPHRRHLRCLLGRPPRLRGHGGEESEYRLTLGEMCGTCHREIKKNQQAHADHAPAVADCVDCQCRC